MILIDENELTIGVLAQIGNELGWNIWDGTLEDENEIKNRLENFLNSVRVIEI